MSNSGKAFSNSKQSGGTRGHSSNDAGLRPRPRGRGAFRDIQQKGTYAPWDDKLARTDFTKSRGTPDRITPEGNEIGGPDDI
jgi:hypothetical protein